MNQNLLTLFAPSITLPPKEEQASAPKPPASTPGDSEERVTTCSEAPGRIRFFVIVAGNAAGFAGLIAGCWLSLQLLQTYL